MSDPSYNNLQADLFSMHQVASAYADIAQLDNAALYEHVCTASGVPADVMDERAPVGTSGQKHSIAKRKVRWIQQTLKKLDMLERVPGRRGVWRLTHQGRRQYGKAGGGMAMVAFSTDLGLALWAQWESVFPRLDETIALCLTSPPYPLRRQRAYGNPSESAYVDFLVQAMTPIVKHLAPGGSICINLSNDIFERGKPSRSLYLERLVLALNDRLGLQLMDRLIWSNPSKPPGPMQWASKTRQQLNVGYEPCYWFTNDPSRCFSDNRRVLLPHSDRHQKLMAGGGEQRKASFSDGAYRLRPGSFGKPTAGKIPKNVLSFGHRCADAIACNQFAKENGLPTHGAPMPLSLADMLVRFLTAPGQLVVDPFAGRCTTGKAAEQNGRRWICTEQYAEHLQTARIRFA